MKNKNASPLAIVGAMQVPAPFFTFSFAAKSCAARQPAASFGDDLPQFMLVNTAVASANVPTV